METLIDSRVTALLRQHLSSTEGTTVGATGGGGVRGRIAVEFYEKKRRKTGAGMWFGGLAGKMAGGGATEEELCWEIWTLDVTIATPRTESGMFPSIKSLAVDSRELTKDMKLERAKVHKAMENMLQKAALKILAVVNRDKDHIPPITTSESNPFPYRIVLNPRSDSWQNRIGLY